LGRQHVRNSVLSIAQQKTGQEVSIPVHRNLRAVHDALPRDNLTFVMPERGKPMTPEGFTNWFRKQVKAVVDDEGKRLLPDDLSLHGLRRRRAADSRKPGAARMRSCLSAVARRLPKSPVTLSRRTAST